MQNTTNLNLKKPDYTDFADIKDINDNMDILDGALHDTQNSVATFTSSDVADGSATSWTTVTKVNSGETHKSIFAKMSQMFKNIRFLYKLLGTTDISAIGNGTVTGGLSSLNSSLDGKSDRVVVTDFKATTSANGVCFLNNFSANNATPIIAYNSDGYGFLIRRSSNNTTKYWIATVTDPSGELVRNATVDVTLRYIPYAWIG